MEEILHQLVDHLSHYLQSFITSQVVQDFFHQHVFPMSSISDLLIPPNGGNVFSPEEWSLVGPNNVTT